MNKVMLQTIVYVEYCFIHQDVLKKVKKKTLKKSKTSASVDDSALKLGLITEVFKSCHQLVLKVCIETSW